MTPTNALDAPTPAKGVVLSSQRLYHPLASPYGG